MREQLSRRQLLRGAGIAAAGVATLGATAPADAADTNSFTNEIYDGYVNDRGGQVFNVTNPAYGAKGDGITDDTGAINAAISAAGASGTLLFPSGTYRITAPITYNGRGGIIGRGGYRAQSGAGNTVLLCASATAGLILNGGARYEGFMVDGNGIAGLPLKNGTISGSGVAIAQTRAIYVDVSVANSAGTGWAIYGARHNAYHDCASVNNAQDGLIIDGGASALEFFHFYESGNLRYGIRGNQAIASTSGAIRSTDAIRFDSGVCGAGTGRPPGVSKIHLRGARSWSFPNMVIDGTNLSGPTVDLDQSAGYGIDLSKVTLSATSTGQVPGNACIQVSGAAPANVSATFLTTDGCVFKSGDTSVAMLGTNATYQYSAIGGWDDHTVNGPYAAAGLGQVDTLFTGRVGPWQEVAAAAPWTGSVAYRFMGERWVEFKGNVQYAGSGTGPILTLQSGYRPEGQPRRIPAAAGAGLGVASIALTGEVDVLPVGATPFVAGATVNLDGLNFPIDGD